MNKLDIAKIKFFTISSNINKEFNNSNLSAEKAKELCSIIDEMSLKMRKYNGVPDVFDSCISKFVQNVIKKEFKSNLFTSLDIYNKMVEMDYLKYIHSSGDKKKSVYNAIRNLDMRGNIVSVVMHKKANIWKLVK